MFQKCLVRVSFLVLLCLAGAGAAGALAAPLPQSGPPAYTYRLIRTWQNEPWTLTAGRFGLVSDISSAPDGTIFVLDTQHRAVHALAPSGRPLRVFLLPKLAET